jgi:hypothetical protein
MLIYYMFDWGDGSMSDWIGPVYSGTPVNATHRWVVAGVYDVKVIARNLVGLESHWSPAHRITIAGPSLEIGNITSGLFRIKAVVTNSGSGDADQVQWNIQLIGDVFIGKDTSGALPSLSAGSGKSPES